MTDKIEEPIFNEKDCKDKVNLLLKFYNKTDMFYPETKEKERELWRNALDSCFKRKCEPGEYGLHGKCVPY